MNIKFIIGAIVLVLLIGGATFTISANSKPATGSVSSAATITYDASGFHPALTMVSAGQAVRFTNSSENEIQVDSDPHPEHTDNPELNVGPLVPGASQSTTLSKKGTFGIHNHLNPSHTAKITIQ